MDRGAKLFGCAQSGDARDRVCGNPDRDEECER
jgi:hypothetical protein